MKKALLILTTTLLSYTATQAQPIDLLRSVFIYNFANMIQWPGGASSGNFVIGILGDSGVRSELEKMATNKKVGTQKIIVENYSSASEIGHCHIIIISENMKAELPKVLTKKQNTLIISEEPGAAKNGAGISFTEVGGKVKFEMSKKNIAASGLKVASSLEKLAILVD